MHVLYKALMFTKGKETEMGFFERKDFERQSLVVFIVEEVFFFLLGGCKNREGKGKGDDVIK